MREKAFTLIEVMVVMAIISILAGMMMPAVWRFWESEEIATTKQRLEDLKLAMVGDRTLIQDGVRRSYGFVGDNGELPFGNLSAAGGLKYLADRPVAGYPKWAGSYMKGGFDRSNYTVDAWGRTFIYTPLPVPPAGTYRYVSAEIRSYGPNGIANDSDDIVVYIEEKEVTPTSRYKGKIPVTITVVTPPLIQFSADVDATYRDPNDATGMRTSEKLACKQFSSGTVTGSFLVYSASHVQKFPIGELSYKANVYPANNTTCTGLPLSTLDSYYFVQDDMKEILLNFPQFNNP
jgi:prepilin-type N-terminal cleavage/methylation domain-containing protein